MVPDSTSLRGRVALVVLVAGYLVLALVGGAPDSPLLPLLPRGAGVPSWASNGADLLAFDSLSRLGLTVLSLLLLGCLLVAFAMVVLEARRGRVQLAPALVAVMASLIVATAAPLLLSRDVHAYAAYGRIYSVHGSNPYLQPPSAFPLDPFARVAPSVWADTRSLYGPGFTLLSAGVAKWFQESPGATIAAFKILSGMATALAVLLVTVAARRVRPGREALAAAVIGLNPVIVVHTVAGGHNDALIAALLAAAVVAAVRAREDLHSPVTGPALIVTALLSLAVLIKSVLVFPLLLWIWAVVRTSRPERRASALAAHVGLALLLGLAFFAPFLEGLRSVTSVATLASVEGWASGPGLVARGAREIGEVLAGYDLGETLARATVMVFLALVALGLWRLGRRADPRLHEPGRFSPADAWGAALLLFALGAPYLPPWYAAWFVPFLALMADERLAAIGLAASLLLALTGVPAEPGNVPALYDGMRLAVHYLAAPAMLALFVAALRRVLASSPAR
jgi:hypothetical protein